MTLSRAYRPYTRIEHFDLDGLLNRLDREMDEGGNGIPVDYLFGAYSALSILRYHEFVDTQEDFMRLLARRAGGGNL